MEAESEIKEAVNAGGEVKFTLKQLIRKLHVVEPVENVMCLVGKRFAVQLLYYQVGLYSTKKNVIRAVRVKLFTAGVLYRVSYQVLEYQLIPDVMNLM